MAIKLDRYALGPLKRINNLAQRGVRWAGKLRSILWRQFLLGGG